MDFSVNYTLFWMAYLAAGAVFYGIFWKISCSEKPAILPYILRGGLLALMLTPWYANSQNEQLAPALMIVTLDAITLGGSAALRALVPLILGLLLALVVSTGLYFKNRKKHRNKKTLAIVSKVKHKEDSGEPEGQS